MRERLQTLVISANKTNEYANRKTNLRWNLQVTMYKNFMFTFNKNKKKAESGAHKWVCQ